jgi:SAM-dependent methyltransferase
MTSSTSTFLDRNLPFAGARTVVRMNWTRYVLAGVIVLATAVSMAFRLSPMVRIALWSGASLALFWSIMSVVGAYLVYDRSALYRFDWLGDVLDAPPARWANIHSGLNSLPRTMLRRLFPKASGVTIDIFDLAEMTEPSIHRVHALLPPDPHSICGRFDDLPMLTGDADAAFIVLAAHELRRDEARLAFFRELHRIVRPGGTVVLVEHTRNLANFIAFGPGAFHVYPRKLWLRAASATGFEPAREVPFTPLARAMILRRLP